MARGRAEGPEPTISNALRDLNVKHLQESLASVPRLKVLRDSRPTEFRTWQDRTLQSLGVVFTKDHDYYTRFRRLDFSVPRMRFGGGGQPWAQMDVEAFDRDIVLAETLLEDALEEANALVGELEQSSAEATSTTRGSDVFIVHGHDEVNLYRLRDMIAKRFKLHPVILKWEAGKGRALIEKFEEEAARCAYAFVLLTPDDQIIAPDGQYTQARPNVVFELGWFYGRLRRSRVAILLKSGTKLHSDLDGISRINFVDSIEEKFFEIERELQAAGLMSAHEEARNRKGSEASVGKADVRARLYASGQHSHHVELSNQGAATASEVDIQFLDQDEDSLFPQGERKDKLPLPLLEPGESVPLMVVLAMGRWPPFRIALIWKDPDGTPRRREDILYGP